MNESYDKDKMHVLCPDMEADKEEQDTPACDALLPAVLVRARELLRKENYTCVLIREDRIYASRQRGIAPLLSCYRDRRIEQGCSAADKVVGKAAAFFYVLLGAGELYAEIISEPAYEVLLKYGITVYYRKKVPAIINRTGDGFCPMETAVWQIEQPEDAVLAVERTMEKLQKKQK